MDTKNNITKILFLKHLIMIKIISIFNKEICIIIINSTKILNFKINTISRINSDNITYSYLATLTREAFTGSFGRFEESLLCL